MLSFRTIAGMGLALFVMHAAGIYFLGTTPGGVVLSDILQTIASVLATAVCFGISRQARGTERRFWGLLSASCGFWALGQSILSYYEVILGRSVPSLSPTDIPFLGFYLGLIAALFLSPDKNRKMDWVRTLDFAQVGLVISSVYLYFFVFEASRSQTRFEALRFNLDNVYDAFNLMLCIAYAGRALTAYPAALRTLYQRVFLFLAVYASCDLAYTYGIAYGFLDWAASSGTWFDLGYSFPFLLVATIAVWKRPGIEIEEEVSGLGPRTAWTHWFALFPPFVVLMVSLYIAPHHLLLAGILLTASFICSSARLSVTQIRQRHSLEMIEASEQRFRSLIEKSSDIIFLFDRDWHIRYVSPHPERVTGYTVDEYLGQLAGHRCHPDDFPLLTEVRERIVHNPNASATIEYRTHHKDSRWVWIQAVVTNLLNDPVVQAVVVNLKDITERKLSEDAIRATGQRFQALIENSHDGIALLDRHGKFQYVKPTSDHVLILSPDNFAGRSVLDLVHLDDLSSFRKSLAEILEMPGNTASGEVRVVRPDGSWSWIEFVGTNLLEDRNVGGIVVNYRNITGRKKAEEAHRALEQRFSKAFHSSLSAMAISRMSDSQVIEVNEKWLEECGLARHEIIGRRAVDLNLWVNPEERNELVMQLKQSGSVREMETLIRRKTGDIRLGLISAEVIDVAGEPCVLFAVQDITDRRHSEEIMRASEQRFSRAFHMSPHAMVISRLEDGLYVDSNDRWLQMVRIPREQLIGRSALKLNVWDNPMDRVRMQGKLKAGQPVRDEEVVFRTSAGEKFLALISAEVIELGGIQCILSAVQDITERKRLEEQLGQSQKLEAIGRLAGGVAHDFNNMLSVMMGRAELLMDRLPAGNPLRGDIEEIHRAGESAASLTRQLLAFSRKQVLAPRIVDLNEVVTDTQKMMRRLIGEDIKFVLHLDAQLGSIQADPGQLEQVLINLVVNARDAMPHGGKLSIETANVILDDEYVRTHSVVSPGPYVSLHISDTGVGMDAATQARVFEPFFTTKEQGKGTGLGLATVYGIVKQSGGFIWVYSEKNSGTTFKVYFPRVAEPVTSEEDSQKTDPHQGGPETILVVEDDVAVRAITCAFLTRGGYHILEANDPESAISIANSFSGRIQLLLTDLVLPGFSGAQLSSQLAARRPEMKTLFVSGYSDHATLNSGLLSGEEAFLQKPFGCTSLLQKVRSVLDGTHQQRTLLRI
ncbi:MAG: PAS domain S-box protein [Acidobacteria bacterium]|nr:PAS domain S-box protein [Acidobacteriota bacterium]